MTRLVQLRDDRAWHVPDPRQAGASPVTLCGWKIAGGQTREWGTDACPEALCQRCRERLHELAEEFRSQQSQPPLAWPDGGFV